ncbi:MAG: response regulator [Candidatus Sulfotelmatobacter sp.]
MLRRCRRRTASAIWGPRRFPGSIAFTMKGMSGPQLQTELKRLGSKIPIIFITAQSDESLRQCLVEQGAVACLLKPFSDTAQLEALNAALQVSAVDNVLHGC